jgi:hypothetical protein
MNTFIPDPSVVQLGYGLDWGNANSNSVQIGYSASVLSADSTDAVQIGAYAGYLASYATGAVQIGKYAGYLSYVSNGAIQIGKHAGYLSYIADGAVQIGYNAGESSDTASRVVQIGYYAGRNATIVTDAVMIGSSAGYNVKTGSYTTFIGSNTDVLSSDLNITKSIAIGYNAKVSSSNTAIIGGTGADAVKVGIGTYDPQATLHVWGNVSASSFIGTLYGTASHAYNAEHADAADFSVLAYYSDLAESASWASSSISASYAKTASYVASASYAPGIAPVKAGIVSGSDFSAGASYTFSVVYSTPFPTSLVSVIVTGEDFRGWAVRSKTAAGFVIDSNSSQPLGGMVYWQSISVGEYY